MKVLILSSSTGAGHDSCAYAVKEVFDNYSEHCEVVETLNYMSKFVAKVVTNGHTVMYRHFATVFKIGYAFLDNHSSSYKKGSLTNRLLSVGSKKLAEYINKNGYDMVVCTHPFSTVMLSSALEKYNLMVKTAFVATDYTCAPTVDAENLDLYFVPDNAIINTFIKYGINEKKIVPSGIPVKQMFYNSVSKSKAKEQMGIGANSIHLLVMCGSMGCGPIKKIVASISKDLPENVEVTVVCGTNKKLRKNLDKKYSLNKKIHTKGFVNNMSEVMDSADLYLTKPGGLSVSEARLKNLPMLFINAVAGCEEYNRRHFVGMKTAVCGDNVKDLSEKCVTLLNNTNQIDEMRNIFENENKMNAAEQIRKELLKLNGEKE